MQTRTHRYAVLAAGLVTGAGLLLPTVPASAGTSSHLPAHRPPVASAASGLSPAALARVRARQRQMIAARKTAPTFAKTGVTTFTVTTTDDTSLATPTDTHCVDAASACSLRAAVEAANNLGTPVRIVLGASTYTLSSATAITVTDAAGVSIVGQGAAKTAVSGAGSGLFTVSPATSGAANGRLSLTSLKLENGTATDGGAIYLDDTNVGAGLVLDHVRATNNTASGTGGVISNVNSIGGSTIAISHSSFSGNHADQGGVIYQYWSDLTITGSTFTANGAPEGAAEGGALYNDRGVVHITGGSISGNSAGSDTATLGDGGAIYDFATLDTLTDVHVDGNVAGSPGSVAGFGGAIYGYQEYLEVNGGTLSHNHAYADSSGVGAGGAIYVQNQSQVLIHGVTMAGNQTEGTAETYGGGAVFVYGSDYPTQLVVDRHSTVTGSNAAALYLYSSSGGIDASIVNSSLTGNSDAASNGYLGQGCAGAICAFMDGSVGINLEMQRDAVSGNSSVGNYGAGAVTAYASGGGLSAVLRHNTFSKNHSGAQGYGGALGFENEGEGDVSMSVRMSGNTFAANRAGSQADGFEGRGGALSTESGVTIADTGSTFRNNHAVGDGAYGGAVSLDSSSSSATWTRTRFTGNSVGTNQEGNTGYGGAVYSDSSADVFKQVTISGNRAASQGGGFYGDNTDYQPSFTSTTISGNTAGTSTVAGQGGGMWLEDSVLRLANSTVTGNDATSVTGTPGQGGAIYLNPFGRVVLRYSTVSANTAQEGGGIYTGASGGSLLSSIVSGNRTSTHGAESDCLFAPVPSQLVSLGGNVLGQKSCVGGLATSDKVTKKPGLKKLADNGGPTLTLALVAKSAAVGRATLQIPSVDQRGHSRPAKHADAGAYELPRTH